MTGRINPTFLLKGVDPLLVRDRYRQGHYSRKVELTVSSPLPQGGALLAPQYGTSRFDPIFTLKDRNNCTVVVATSGHEIVKQFLGGNGVRPQEGRCEYCLVDFHHEAAGYPVAYQEHTVKEQGRHRILHCFWDEGCFCSLGCALGYLERLRPGTGQDPLLAAAERHLRRLFSLLYPQAGSLRSHPDPRLLKSNGGSLTREEWEDGRYHYRRTDQVLLLPVKAEYLRELYHHPVEVMRPHP